MCGLLFFAAVALSVIDTSSSNFLPENWTQFPIKSQSFQDGQYPKVTVNSHKKDETVENPTWGSNWTDVIGISNAVISQVPKGKEEGFSSPNLIVSTLSPLLFAISLAEPSLPDDFVYVCILCTMIISPKYS